MFNIFGFFVFCCFVLRTEASSFSNKHEERKFQLSSAKDGPFVDWLKIDDAQYGCNDDWENCMSYGNLCSTVRVIRERCKGTCRLCERVAAPPDCKLTQFGCCWDNITIATSKHKEECPPCQDKYSECKNFDCNRPDIRIKCPTTCRVPCSQCLDNKYQITACPLYKRYGICELAPQLMRYACQKTCGLCSSTF